jgi:hypothetical protein
MKVISFLLFSALAVSAWQKVDLKSIDAAQKKAGADQAAASKAAADSTALERYKLKERSDAAKKVDKDRFSKLEEGLKEVREARAKEVQDAKDAADAVVKRAAEDHADLMKAIRNASIGVIATLIGALIMFAAKSFSDRRHHRREESQIAGLVNTSNHIKGLVNSTYTAALQGRLDSTQIALTALLEVVASAEKHGEVASPETKPRIEAARKTIRELEITLADRLKA